MAREKPIGDESNTVNDVHSVLFSEKEIALCKTLDADISRIVQRCETEIAAVLEVTAREIAGVLSRTDDLKQKIAKLRSGG